MQPHHALTSLVLIALATAGCKQDADPAAAASHGAPGAAGEQATGSPDAAKLSGYTGAYNKLIDTFGLTETAKDYAEKGILGRSASDSISITDGWVDQGLAAMRKARALPGGPAALDQSADRLIAALDKAVTRVKALKIYYDAKSYKEDGLARGKREDPLMKAEFAAALDAMHAFDTVLSAERNRQDERDMAVLKAKGDNLGYQTKLALKQGEQLVDLFKSEADIRDPARIARADALVATLETALTDQRKAYAEAQAKAVAAKTEAPDSDYERVATYLTSLVGDYREMKRSRDADDVNDMVKEYNNAVEDANDIE